MPGQKRLNGKRWALEVQWKEPRLWWSSRQGALWGPIVSNGGKLAHASGRKTRKTVFLSSWSIWFFLKRPSQEKLCGQNSTFWSLPESKLSKESKETIPANSSSHTGEGSNSSPLLSYLRVEKGRKWWGGSQLRAVDPRKNWSLILGPP